MKRCTANWLWLVVLVVGSFQETSSNTAQCNQYNKQCTIITNCTSALEAVVGRNDKLLREMFCGYDGKLPKVCCPVERPIVFHNDEETATSRLKTTSTTINPTTIPPNNKSLIEKTVKDIEPTHTANGLPTIKECGISGAGSDRIFGGSIAGIDEFPWLARILIINIYGRKRFQCGGSLITRQFVLTAAHCVQTKVDSVRLGDWDTEAEKDCVGDYCSDPPVDVNVTQVLIHPTYRKRLYVADIALLRLEKSINYTDFIRPVCLPVFKNVADQDYVPGTVFTTAGWGLTELGSASVIKQKVELETVPLDVCKIKMVFINRMDPTKILCAGGSPGKDTCNGDSGGPLVKEITENFNTNWYLFGITSFGATKCGKADTPSVYTRVVSYMDWIIQTINE